MEAGDPETIMRVTHPDGITCVCVCVCVYLCVCVCVCMCVCVCFGDTLNKEGKKKNPTQRDSLEDSSGIY